LEIPVGNLATLADLKKEDQSDLVVLVTGNGEKLFRVLQRIANNELIEECGFTFEEEDLIVIAAQSNPGTEVIAVKTLDELYRTGASILNVTRRMISSMHAQEEDLKLVISILQPKYYLPISGYYRQLLANATVASSMDIGLNHKNILVYDNGMVAKFENRNYKSGEPLVQTGELMVDGLGMFDAGSVVINDRNKLSEDGVIILGVGVDYNTKEIIAGPDIQTRGLIFVKDSDDLLKGIEKLYREVVVETFKDRKLNYTEKRQIIRDKISKYVKKETGKDPMILSMIVEI
ncbi:TPA: ribonuclease J, partial [bacterium]|nr:ribonuclease J [bacterium]